MNTASPVAAANAERGRERRWVPGWSVDISGTLGPLVRGSGDPAHRRGPDGFWWAARTPVGPGTLHLRRSGPVVDATAWGPGADWLLDLVPRLLGAGDDWSTLDVTGWPGLERVRRARPGVRLPRTELILDSLVPAVLEQRVTGKQARSAWRSLLLAHGELAPGPGPGLMPADLRIPPTPAQLLNVPTWDWSRWDVDLHRQRAVRAVATVAGRLEECAGMTTADAAHRLQLIPGIGIWTAAETTQRALGDPDAVSVNDYHVHNQVVFAFTGRARGSDEEMLELLEPWRGQRQRVVRLIELAGIRAPRFGPRQSLDRPRGS